MDTYSLWTDHFIRSAANLMRDLGAKVHFERSFPVPSQRRTACEQIVAGAGATSLVLVARLFWDPLGTERTRWRFSAEGQTEKGEDACPATFSGVRRTGSSHREIFRVDSGNFALHHKAAAYACDTGEEAAAFWQSILAATTGKLRSRFTKPPCLLSAVPTKSQHWHDMLRRHGGEPLEAAEKFGREVRSHFPAGLFPAV